MRVNKANRPDQRVFIAAHILLACFTLYSAAWLAAVLLSLGQYWDGQALGIDVAAALTHMALPDHILFYLLCGAAFATQALLLLRRRAAVYTMVSCVALHFTFWVRMSLNPIWDSPIGLAVIAVETLILLLLLRLQHARMLT